MRTRRTPELVAAIDSGRTGDKVDHPDPSAAPLGTDEEAAGLAPPAAAVSAALEQETRYRPPAPYYRSLPLILLLVLPVMAGVLLIWISEAGR